MKKLIIIILLVFNIFLGMKISFAQESLTPNEKETNLVLEKIYVSYEEEFIKLYKKTDEELMNPNTFFLFRLMGQIYRANKLDQKYYNGEIKSKELSNIVKEILDATKAPKTARDFFYKGLFAYPSHRRQKRVIDEMIEPFEYLIEHFPDSLYIRDTYLLLAENYEGTGNDENRKKSTELYIKYLNKYKSTYDKNDPFVPIIYLNLATSGSYLFGKDMFIKSYSFHKERVEIMLKYSDKILKEFPEEKDMVGDVLCGLGYYNLNVLNDFDKAFEYFSKVYNDTDNYDGMGAGGIIDIYSRKKEYQKLEKFLEDLKTRYPNNRSIKEVYRLYKLNLEEIKRFGYDRYDKKKEPLTEEKREIIRKFRTEYEKCFDKDFNLIKPIESISLPPVKGEE